jgi:hypothetical protein
VLASSIPIGMPMTTSQRPLFMSFEESCVRRQHGTSHPWSHRRRDRPRLPARRYKQEDAFLDGPYFPGVRHVPSDQFSLISSIFRVHPDTCSNVGSASDVIYRSSLVVHAGVMRWDVKQTDSWGERRWDEVFSAGGGRTYMSGVVSEVSPFVFVDIR